MFHSLPAGVSLIVLSIAASVSSQTTSAFRQCWQVSVVAPPSGAHCSERDLNCICGSLITNLDGLFDCVRDASQTSPLPQEVRKAVDSILVGCSSETPLALSYPDLMKALNAANDQTIPQKELKARAAPAEEEGEKQVLAKRASAAAAGAAQTTPSPPSLQVVTTPTAVPTTGSPNAILMDNGMATASQISTYTDTPPLVVSIPPTGTSSSASKSTDASSSGGDNGGTLLDMSGAAHMSGRGRKSLLGLTICVLACVAWF